MTMVQKNRRCRPTLWHLFILLFFCLCLISLSFYSLNAYFENRSTNDQSEFFKSSPLRHQDFKADFRTLPHTLPGGRRRLVILINSNWRNFDRRLSIRNTWAMNQNRFNCSVFFVVGDSDDESISGVVDEGAFFHDVIQPTVWESDQNTILKLLAAFRFLERELEADFVMKTNDDVFVNLPDLIDFLQPYAPSSIDNSDRFQNRLADYLQSNSNKIDSDSIDRPQRLIFGNRIEKATPSSVDSQRRDFMSEHFWPRNAPFPDYVAGSGYVFSFDVMRRFNICPRVVALLPLEDVYFTGVCRQHFGLPLEHNEKFAFSPRLKIPCLWKSKFVTGRVKHNEMIEIWNAVNRKNIPKC